MKDSIKFEYTTLYHILQYYCSWTHQVAEIRTVMLINKIVNPHVLVLRSVLISED